MKAIRVLSLWKAIAFLTAATFLLSACSKELATVKTGDIKSVSTDTAVVTGAIVDDGGSNILSYGICYSINSLNPNITDKIVPGSRDMKNFSVIMKLSPGVTYYLRAYATNSVGTSYGSVLMLTALGGRVSVSSVAAISIDTVSAVLTAKVNGNNLPTKVSFEYGETANYGQIIDVPGTISGNVDVSVTIRGLNPATAYHFRVDTENSFGAINWLDQSFKTQAVPIPPLPPTPDITDIDGNVYHTIRIGTQVWLVEDLKTTHYNDGTPIPNVKDSATWLGLTSGAYIDYNNDINLAKIYGHLYNWYAVNTGKLAPKGWHVPSYEEWGVLQAYIMATYPDVPGTTLVGAHMKEVGTAHWKAPNSGADNKTGFTAIPGGGYYINGPVGPLKFYDLTTDANWWAITKVDNISACAQCVKYNRTYFVRGGGMYFFSGFSVRCVQD